MLLPYASDRPPGRIPLVVLSLVLFQFALFGLMAWLVQIGRNFPFVWYANLGLVPASLHWWSPLTYLFLHFSLFHVATNGLFLWVFGGSVEDAIGWKRFLALYLVAGAVSGLLQVLVERILGGAGLLTPIVGSSGAIAAVVGVFAIRFYRSRIRFIGLPIRIPAVVLVSFVLMAEMCAAAWRIVHRDSTGIDLSAHWSHIGGFLLGLVWAQANKMVHAGRNEYLSADAAMEMERGSPLAATVRWEAVLEANPDDVHARAELGRAWALAGDKEQSYAAYKLAIAGLLRKGDKREAVARFLEMRGCIPDSVLDAFNQLSIASALEEAGKYEESVGALDTILATYSDSSESEMALLRSGALLLRRLNSPAEAIERLERFIDRHPESSWRPFAEDLLKTARRTLSTDRE